MNAAFNKITENTLLPISLVIILAGGIMWLSSVWHQGNANAHSISELKEQRKYDREEIMRKLEIIDAKLDRTLEIKGSK
jgi:hypothetical protein